MSDAKKPKIKLSEHQRENVESGKGGHNYGVKDAEYILDHSEFRITDPVDKREIAWAPIGSKLVKAVVSATVSAGNFISRIVTIHDDPKGRKRWKVD